MTEQEVIQDMIERFKQALDESLPAGAWRAVYSIPGFGGTVIHVSWAASDKDIHGVKGQKPQRVTMVFDPHKLEFWSSNRRPCIWREPNRDIPKEKHLAMKQERIRFRMPSYSKIKSEDGRKLASIQLVKKICKRWVEMLTLHLPTLCHGDLVDYNELLNEKTERCT